MKRRPIIITIRVDHDQIVTILDELGLPPTERNLTIARKAIHERLDALPGDDDWDRINDKIAGRLGIDYSPDPNAYPADDDDDHAEEEHTR